MKEVVQIIQKVAKNFNYDKIKKKGLYSPVLSPAPCLSGLAPYTAQVSDHSSKINKPDGGGPGWRRWVKTVSIASILYNYKPWLLF